MHAACDGGHVEIVKLLLTANGIDVNKGVSIDLMKMWTYIINQYVHPIKKCKYKINKYIPPFKKWITSII